MRTTYTRDNLPKDIYEFAFATGRKVIEPKRYRRPAMDLGIHNGRPGDWKGMGTLTRLSCESIDE